MVLPVKRGKMLVTNKYVLNKANNGHYAVPAFNIQNMESLQAIASAASEKMSPVIVQTTEGAIEYAGVDYLSALVKVAAQKHRIPMTLHLDHGKRIETIKECIRQGYTSVMIDASSLPFEKNVSMTRKVVRLAHARRISVEAELGTLGGVEDAVSGKVMLTDPDVAQKFVRLTNVDSLAVAIGTSHGAYKFKGESKLDFSRLKEIKSTVDIPLVLHGASGIPDHVIKIAQKYGAKLPGAKGVSDEDIKRAVKLGINKVNIDSDLRLSFTAAVRKVLAEKPDIFDPREIIGPARSLMSEIVRHKIELLGSKRKG